LRARGRGKRRVAEWLAGELLGIKDTVALLNHPDVFVVAREIDEKTKKLKKISAWNRFVMPFTASP